MKEEKKVTKKVKKEENKEVKKTQTKKVTAKSKTTPKVKEPIKKEEVIKETKEEVTRRRKDEGSFFTRYIKSIGHAMDGINYAVEGEHNLIGIMIYSIIMLILAIFLPITLTETIIVVLTIGLLIIFEMVNTSVEAIVDLITLEDNKLAKIAKDTISAADLIMIFITVVINLIIFIPKIISFFQGIM